MFQINIIRYYRICMIMYNCFKITIYNYRLNKNFLFSNEILVIL